MPILDMTESQRELTVNLGNRSYPICIGRDLGADVTTKIAGMAKTGRRGAILIDEIFLKSQPVFSEQLTAQIPYLEIPSGESSKSIEELSKVWSFLATSKIDRSGFILAVGGGVVGDLAGFAAASFLRGVSFYQVPTTLLAMVDSSVGGKTGINLEAGKNLVGSFHQPEAVWADLNLLKTLPAREFSAGMAEVVKYGMLGDGELFEQLIASERTFSAESENLSELILRCCSIKAEIVQEDEHETSRQRGGRALLNLGHTFAHAIEKVSGYGSYLHGEAVAIGLVCAFRLSKSLGKCSKFSESELLNLLSSYNLPTGLRIPIKLDDLMHAMHADKKVQRGVLRFVVIEEIGDAYCCDDIDLDSVVQVWASVGAN